MWPLLSTLAAGALLVFLPGEDVGFDRYHVPKELWAAALAVPALVVAAHRRLALDWTNGLAALLCCGCAVSALAAVSPSLTLRPLTLLFTAASLFVVARTCDEAERRRVAIALVSSVGAVAAVALLEAAGLAHLSQEGRAPGATLGQRNAVAHLVLVACPVAWGLAVRSPSARQRAALLALSVMFGAVLLVSRSRAVWLASPLVALAWYAVAKGRPATLLRPAPVLAAVLGAALMAAAPVKLDWSQAQPYADTWARLVDTSTGSGRGRLTQYRASLSLLAQRPLFGAGPGNWAVVYPTVSPPGDPTFRADDWLPTGRAINSDLLALATECGAVAVALAAALALLLARLKEPLPVLVALLALGALDAVVQTPAAAVCAALALGLEAPDGGARRARPAVALAAAALLAALCVPAARRVVGVAYRLGGDVESLERAVAASPADLVARTQLTEARLLHDGTCDHARPHLAVLLELLPHHPWVRQQARVCGVLTRARAE